MKTSSKKLFATAFASIKVLATTVSSLSMAMIGSAHAAPADATNAPMMSQTAANQQSVAEVVASIKSSAGGNVTADNVQSSIQQAMQSNPGASVQSVAAAVNQLGLDSATTASAVEGASNQFGISQADFVSAMINNTYMSQGPAAARAQVASLRKSLGDQVVNAATASMDQAALSQTNLAQIEPAAGVYEG